MLTKNVLNKSLRDDIHARCAQEQEMCFGSHDTPRQWFTMGRKGKRPRVPLLRLFAMVSTSPSVMQTCHVPQIHWYLKKRHKTTDLQETRIWVKTRGLTFLCDGFPCLLQIRDMKIWWWYEVGRNVFRSQRRFFCPHPSVLYGRVLPRGSNFKPFGKGSLYVKLYTLNYISL